MKTHLVVRALAVRTLVPVLALAWSAAVLASPPQASDGRAVELDPVRAARAGVPPGSLTLDCARLSLPSQGEMARLSGIANPGQAYAARARLMVNVQRACRGADVVRVIGTSQPQAVQALARVTP